jgi:hypothetical protein
MAGGTLAGQGAGKHTIPRLQQTQPKELTMRLDGLFGIGGGSSPLQGISALLSSLGGTVGGGAGQSIGKMGQGFGIFSGLLGLFGKSAGGGPLGFLTGLLGIAQQAIGLFGGKKT